MKLNYIRQIGENRLILNGKEKIVISKSLNKC